MTYAVLVVVGFGLVIALSMAAQRDIFQSWSRKSTPLDEEEKPNDL